MRIGLVCPYSLDRPGGVQQQVLGLAAWLHRRGHRVSVLAPGRPAPEPWVESTGRAVPVPWNGSVARIAAGPLTAARVRRWLAAVRPDVLHLHEPFTPSAAGWALMLAAGTPVVATCHAAVDPTSRQAAIARTAGALTPGLPRRIGIATAPSTTAAATARAHWGLVPRIVPNAIDVGAYAGDREPGERTRLTFLGRLDEPRKGLPVLLAALPELRRRIGDFELQLIGPGSVPDAPEVRPFGRVDEATKAALLRRTDVLVAPNTGGESFGIVLAEALAAGAGVAASDLPGFGEVLGPVGRRFPAGDPAALAAAVAAELAAPDPAGRRARASRFDWAQIGPQVLQAYADAAIRPEPPPSG
ncbi:glycosyltransferase family 4 protein [Enemella evansiae]|uniref:glycosyltransferase family 4 protein n=1 Tax=Enemella evansiae TaxID=2016499 RepID=UPI00105D10D4|nr:glycosyltransferase family 4 protein [Enemella evansiae]TDO92936.1 phosphatidylinositol alpha-mannosyltransferase [Enemella evansiae]